MRRAELYRVRHPAGDPKRSRVYVVVSRPAAILSKFSTVICAPVYSSRLGMATQVAVGSDEGLKHESAVYCDELQSIHKTALTDYVGRLSPAKVLELDRALALALGLTA